ncbi:MAG: ATP-binding cassette domain-containing protein, partial [Pseudomonadales bacterium]|nr:ATP-binding cassette domain-containing protein [Pseudomonadales bacterium]
QHFSGSIFAMLPKLSELRMINLELERVGDILSTAKESDGEQYSLVHVPMSGDIVFSDVTFAYPGTSSQPIQSLNYKITAGRCTAITGPSGSGKTTLLKLLLKLESPTEGQILIGGTDIVQINKSEVRSRVGAVLHDDSLLAGDLAYNINLGVEADNWKRLDQISRRLGISELVKNLPLGYSTEIGEMGSVLSAGQVQRILLARALFRNPQLLILDEALSHLNKEAALSLLEELKSTGATIVLVTHDTSVIAACDEEFCLG